MTNDACKMYCMRPPPPGQQEVITSDGTRVRVECVGNIDVVFHERECAWGFLVVAAAAAAAVAAVAAAAAAAAVAAVIAADASAAAAVALGAVKPTAADTARGAAKPTAVDDGRADGLCRRVCREHCRAPVEPRRRAPGRRLAALHLWPGHGYQRNVTPFIAVNSLTLRGKAGFEYAVPG